MTDNLQRNATDEEQGLYDPANEHDACGVGFVVDMHGRASHEIVRRASKSSLTSPTAAPADATPTLATAPASSHRFRTTSSSPSAKSSTSRCPSAATTVWAFCSFRKTVASARFACAASSSWSRKKGWSSSAGGNLPSIRLTWAASPRKSSRSCSRRSSPAAKSRASCSIGSCSSSASGWNSTSSAASSAKRNSSTSRRCRRSSSPTKG